MKKKVLVIDDEVHIVKIIQYKLKLDGYEVLCALSGEEGLKIAYKDTPDIILLDIMMPTMNGYEVLDQLKKNENTKNIPVIMVTAKNQEADMLKAELLGIVEYITKPFSPQAVLETVKKFIGSP